MVKKVFAVYDRAVKAYMSPFMMLSQGEALRSWMDAVNDEKTQFHLHPEDFTLFEIADYDDETGKYGNLQVPEVVATALKVLKKDGLKSVPAVSQG